MYSVLLVDDEPSVLTGLRYVLDWDEYGVEIAGTASNGTQALELLRELPVDILITDIQMPQMGGLELLQQVRAQNMDLRCIILTGYDDFKYVKKAAQLGIENYLLKPVSPEELSETLLNTITKIEYLRSRKLDLAENIRVLRDGTFYRWIAGRIGGAELADRFDTLGFTPDTSGYTVMLLRMAGERERIDAVCRRRLADILAAGIPEGMHIPGFFDFSDNFVLLVPNRNAGQFLPHLRRIVSEAQSRLSCDVFAFAGTPEKALLDVHRSYAAAQRVLDYALISAPGSVICYSETLVHASAASFPLPDYAKLERLLGAREFDGADALIDRYYELLSGASGMTPADVRDQSVELLYHIISAFRALSVDLSAVSKQESGLYERILSFSSIRELSAWMRGFLSSLVEALEARSSQFTPCVAYAVEYVKREYARDISLKTLSNLLNISAAYLGQLFKNETGELFSNYLNKLRIERSKALLRDTSLTLNEIAQQVGYANASYFYNIFKKYTNKTPSQYRKMR